MCPAVVVVGLSWESSRHFCGLNMQLGLHKKGIPDVWSIQPFPVWKLERCCSQEQQRKRQAASTWIMLIFLSLWTGSKHGNCTWKSAVLHFIQKLNKCFGDVVQTADSWFTLAGGTGACSYIMWASQCRISWRSKTTGEVLVPVTSFWVSPRCFLWSEVSKMPPDVTLWPSSMTHDPFPSAHGPQCWRDSRVNRQRTNRTLTLSARKQDTGKNRDPKAWIFCRSTWDGSFKCG